MINLNLIQSNVCSYKNTINIYTEYYKLLILLIIIVIIIILNFKTISGIFIN